MAQPVQVSSMDGTVSVFHVPVSTTIDVPAGTTRYVVKAEDTFETIAEREYSNGNKWYILARANPDIFWPLDLRPGLTIWIPPRAYAESR